jgi:hypothetical protein
MKPSVKLSPKDHQNMRSANAICCHFLRRLITNIITITLTTSIRAVAKAKLVSNGLALTLRLGKAGAMLVLMLRY